MPNRPAPADLYLNAATLMQTPTDRVLEAALGAGFRGIEPRAERLLDARAELLAAAAAGRGSPGAFWGLNGVGMRLLPDGRLDRARLEADLDRRLEVCAALGTPRLLMVPPVAPGLAVPDPLGGVREGIELARDATARAGVVLAFEFLGVAGCPVGTPHAAAAVTEQLEGVVLVLDSYHWHLCGRPSLDGFPVERLAIVHLNDLPDRPAAELRDADRLLPGEGVLPLADLVRDLEERGYRGPYSLETFNPAHWAADPARLAARAFGSISALLGPAEGQA